MDWPCFSLDVYTKGFGQNVCEAWHLCKLNDSSGVDRTEFIGLYHFNDLYGMSVDISYEFKIFLRIFLSLLATLLLTCMRPLCKLQNSAYHMMVLLAGLLCVATLCTYRMWQALSTGFQVSVPPQTCWPDSVPQACGKPAPLGVMVLKSWGSAFIYACLIPEESFGHLGVLER